MSCAQRSVRPVLAYVVHALNPGGTERLVVEMSRAFSECFEIHVFCLDEPGLWAQELRATGIAVHGLWRQPGLDWRVVGALASHFKRYQVELIHAHQCPAWFYAGLARLLYRRAPLLFEEHGRFYPEADRPLRRLFNRLVLAPLTTRIVAVSADIRERLVRFEGLRRERIEVVYNGVKTDRVLDFRERDSIRRECGFRPNDFVVGSVGRMDPIKNLPMTIESLAKAMAREPRIAGLLVGDGPERHAIEACIERKGLVGRVRLTGYRADARRLTACMDLFLLTSWSEGTSMALLEAMATGVPAAVTSVGGNPELVKAGETGWLVAAGDTEALADVILEAATDEPRRTRFAIAGSRRFDQLFQFSRMIERYSALYATMLSGPRGVVGAAP